jgi:filamentous hemagglutinin family protein
MGMVKNGLSWGLRLGVMGAVAGWGTIASVHPAFAQVIPDSTLGAESSTVSPETIIRGILSNQIDGGAIRGSNLFHSFSEFNVGDGKGIYFANPVGIENILSRVTGQNPSEILGTLGVLGNANLFLLNPNGILFGANAKLDVAGSFFASTADAIALGNQGFYSATTPQNSTLLAINPSVSFANHLTPPSGKIRNEGNLATGQDLTLFAQTLELQGQLQAGRNLTLHASDTVQIRDSATRPFVATAAGQLLVQGNQTVDILALSHPQSGLFSGSDMVLRSSNAVSGDAHYWSGGNFRVEQLNGSVGNLFSLYDPIILAAGDVPLGNYTGPSLHILAGGSVSLGDVVIDGVGGFDDTINPNNPDPFLAILSLVNLSDGSPLNGTGIIDGANRFVLDVRAGIDWLKVPGFATSGFFNFPPIPTATADITINSFATNGSNLGGIVFLSNQYYPNALAAPTGITIGSIDTGGQDGGGSVTVDSRSGITLNGTIITSAFNLGSSGDVTFRAIGDILFNPGSEIDSNSVNSDPNNPFGTIRIESTNGSVLFNQAQILAENSGTEFAGDIFIDARNQIVLQSSNISANGRSGRIFIGLNTSDPQLDPTAPTAVIIDGASTITTTNGIINGAQDAGRINVRGELVGLFNRSFLIADTVGDGNSGGISIQSQVLGVSDGSEVLARTTGAGTAGDVTVQPLNPAVPSFVFLSGIAPFLGVVQDPQGNFIADGGFSSGLFSTSEAGATGSGGTVSVTATNLSIADGAVLSARTRSSVAGGNIVVNVENLNITGGGQIIASAFNTGAARDIQVNATGTVNISGIDAGYDDRFQTIFNAFVDAFLTVPGTTLQDAQQQAFSATQFTVDPASRASGLQASEFSGTGTAGNISLTGQTVFLSDRAAIEATTNGVNDGGDIDLTVQNLTVSGGAAVLTQTFGSGSAGDITVAPIDPNAPSSVTLSGIAPFLGLRQGLFGNPLPDGGFSSGLLVTTENPLTFPGTPPTTTNGAGGTITVTTGALRIEDGAVLSARSRSGGVGGNIALNVGTLDILNGGQILTAAYRDGSAGSITVTATGDVRISGSDAQFLDRFNQIQQALINAGIAPDEAFELAQFTVDPVNGSSGLQALSLSETSTGSGEIAIGSANGSIFLSDEAELSTSTAGLGDAGNVALVANLVSLDNAKVFSQVDATSTGNAGTILIAGNTVSLANNSQLQTQTSGRGSGGNGSQAGNVAIVTDGGVVAIDNSAIFSSIEPGGEGQGGSILINTGSLFMSNGAQLQTLLRQSLDPAIPAAKGEAGVVFIQATNNVSLTGGSGIFSTIEPGADGTSGNNAFAGGLFDILFGQSGNQSLVGSIFIQTGNLFLADNSQLNASTLGKGNAGAVAVLASGNTVIENGSGILSGVGATGEGNAGGIVMQTGSLAVSGPDAGLTTQTEGQGDAGLIFVIASEDISLRGSGSGIFSTVGQGSTFTSGGIGITARNLLISDGATVSVDNLGQGQKEAGSIFIGAQNILLDRRGEIVATTNSGNGGNITLEVPTLILLRRNSQIRTDAGKPVGGGDGGIIRIRQPYIVAVPSRDSNITAQAYNGNGGFVDVVSRGLFGIDFRDEDFPDSNDITANSRNPSFVDGSVIVNAPDTDFLQNSLSELPENLIDTNSLIANSCIVRRNQQEGSFTVTGSGNLPLRPGDASVSPYPTGTVRPIAPEPDSESQPEADSPQSSSRKWQMGDPIVEPQGVYQVNKGTIVMSRECEPDAIPAASTK